MVRVRHDVTKPAVLTNGLVVLLAVACGVAVANLYYAQPLLHAVAGTFHTGPGTAGLIVTASQIGYVIGLVLLVPVGDMVPRRRLVPAVLCVTAIGLVLSSLAPNIAVLVSVAAIVGLGSVAAEMLVPLAASMADDNSRGAVVGKVMTGLLLGILLARTLSGFVAGFAGWRGVYAVAAVLVVALAVLLAARLPDEHPSSRERYSVVLRSAGALLLHEPVLRRRAAFGALVFAAFSAFWTTMAFVLAGPPFRYSETVIGLFGLVGAAGAICANVAGRLADRGEVHALTGWFAVATLASFGCLWEGRRSLAWMIVGILLLDVGVQGMQVTNQSVIYGVAPLARSRITAAYMACYFAGGAAGSAVAAQLYGSHGWAGICLLGGCIGMLTVVGFVLNLRYSPRSDLCKRLSVAAGATEPGVRSRRCRPGHV